MKKTKQITTSVVLAVGLIMGGNVMAQARSIDPPVANSPYRVQATKENKVEKINVRSLLHIDPPVAN